MKNSSFFTFLYTIIIMLGSVAVKADTFTIEGWIDYSILQAPAPQVEVHVFSENGTADTIVLTKPDGSFSLAFEVDAMHEVFIVEVVDLCSGAPLLAKVVSGDTTVHVSILMCELDNFPCQASFTYDKLDSTNIQFTDFSFDQIDRWYWDFGDGESSVEQHPLHNYLRDGEYVVSLHITASDSCTSDFRSVIYVGPQPCICPEYYQPVCVLDTTTGEIIEFPNACFAKCEGYTDFVPCDACNCPLYLVAEPVCVRLEDGRILNFPNPCEARCQGFEDFFPCESNCDCSSAYDPVCVIAANGQRYTFPNACYAECSGYADYYKCDTCICPAIYSPVCVTTIEGVTIEFENACQAQCAGFTDFKPCVSNCFCDDVFDPVCVILDDGTVQQYQSACQAICEGYNVFYNCDIACDCSDEYAPVCVVAPDGTIKTFANVCMASCAGYYDFVDCSKDDFEGGTPSTIKSTTPSISINAYPNPFKEFLNINSSLPGQVDYTITMTDLVGRTVTRQLISPTHDSWTLAIPTQDFPSGIYILGVEGGSVMESLKLIKQ